MPLRGIYAITDDRLLPEEFFMSRVEQALAAGVHMLQYRSKESSLARKHSRAAMLLDLCQQYSVPLIINDDVALAAAIQAQGVHLGQKDGSPAAARKLLGEEAIIGVSCHDDIDLACQAQAEGASYVAFGRFFPSQSKPEAPAASISVLSTAKTRLDIPVVAIGGINPENGASLIEAGADMLAVIDAIFGANNIPEQTQKMIALFQDPVIEGRN